MTTNEYIKLMVPLAQAGYNAAPADKKIHVSICLAQGALESGWGGTTLFTKANNSFGIKSTSSWTNSGGATYTVQTKEQDANGKEYTVTAAFRKYSSLQDSVNDYFKFFRDNSRYSKCFNKATAQETIQAIKDAGYATDINYVNKVMNIVNQYKLEQYDIGSSTVVTPNPDEGKPVATGLYTVQKGDTLSGIAKKYNLTLEELKALNPQIKDPDVIQIGQEVTVNKATIGNTFTPYMVKVTATDLNIRSGPGTGYPVVGTMPVPNTFTIVQESGNWGKLKSGAGWFSLNYAKKV